ncbi:MAG TPA: nuclear transport factor 2 family protein [Ignavibacteriaceae bacterium]|nr:nuclear transport factor 2 family protein [Ignavibacteriaceae bacterium]
MKIVILIFLLFPLFFFTTNAQKNKPDITLMKEINNSWSTLNPTNASKYYDTSSINVFYDVTPFKYVGWKSYSEGAKEYFKTLSSMKYTVGEDAIVHINGNFAYGTSTLNQDTVDKNQKKDSLEIRWTVILEKKEKAWLIVHEHLSIPAGN